MSVLSGLEPKALWTNFEDLNGVPRPSKKEERVIAFMVDFGENLGLATAVDHIGNVLIKKPAYKGYEDRPTVALQSHLDMVHQKNEGTDFDFESEGIKMLIDGDWVKAQGTTLGADNGIGVATIMAILASNDIPHPAIEALFTIDEETGLTGALELKGGWLSAKYLLNLDTEDDNELTIGCAGGIDITAKGTYKEETISSDDHQGLSLKLYGLTGGHSGMDIHIGLGNANKLMNRLLKKLVALGVKIGSVEGGLVRNAIPREAKAILLVQKDKIAAVSELINAFHTDFTKEYRTTDPSLAIEVKEIAGVDKYVSPFFIDKFIDAVYSCPNGIYRMSPEIKGLVQTSNNLARVSLSQGKFEVSCLTRSSVESEKYDLVEAIESSLQLDNVSISKGGDYPGWTPMPDATIVKTMSDIYKTMFEEQPHVNACHAGLECGILGRNYPNMEMISFGPNIRGAHSPDEKVQISSVQKYWTLLLKTLKELK